MTRTLIFCQGWRIGRLRLCQFSQVCLIYAEMDLNNCSFPRGKLWQKRNWRQNEHIPAESTGEQLPGSMADESPFAAGNPLRSPHATNLAGAGASFRAVASTPVPARFGFRQRADGGTGSESPRTTSRGGGGGGQRPYKPIKVHPSHSYENVAAVEAAMRVAADGPVGVTPRLSTARHALVDELEAAGCTGITSLRSSGALSALAARGGSDGAGGAAGAGSATPLQTTNAMRDEYVADWWVTLDVLTCGAVSKRWQRLGDTRVFFRSRDGALLRTDLRGAPYDSFMAARRLTLIALGLLLGVVLFIVVVSVAPTLALWLADLAPPTLQLLGLAGIGTVMIVVLLMTYLTSQRKARSLGGVIESGRGSLPILLPVLLEPTVHRFMISYSWVSSLKDTARSLARVLPDAWLDTRQLVSPDDIPQATTHIATHCSGLVLMLTQAYLTSPNCCAEIVSAALFRGPVRYVTVALMPQRASDAIGADSARKLTNALARLGVPVLATTPQLLFFLDHHALRVSTASSLARTVAWWRQYSRPRSRIPAHLQLMSPQQRRGGRVLSFWGLYSRSKGIVIAGTDHIAGDCSGTGRIVRVTSQQKAAITCIVLAGLMCAYPFLTYFVAPDWQHSRSPYLWGPTIILIVISLSAFQIISGLDARALHDAVLLPLNVAAYINEDSEATAMLGAFTVAVITPPGGLDERGRRMVDTLRAFIQDVAVGVPCVEEDAGAFSRRVVAACSPLIDDVNKAEAAVANLTAEAARRLASAPAAAWAGSAASWSSATALAAANAHLKRQRAAAGALGASGAAPLTIYLWMLDARAAPAWADAVRADTARIAAARGQRVADNGPALATTAPGSLLSQSVLVADRSIFGTKTTPPVGRHLCLVFGEKEGIDADSPYPSMAKAVLDSLGRKVASVLATGGAFVGGADANDDVSSGLDSDAIIAASARSIDIGRKQERAASNAGSDRAVSAGSKGLNGGSGELSSSDTAPESRSTWEEFWSDTKAAPFWSNSKTGETTWIRPANIDDDNVDS